MRFVEEIYYFKELEKRPFTIIARVGLYAEISDIPSVTKGFGRFEYMKMQGRLLLEVLNA